MDDEQSDRNGCVTSNYLTCISVMFGYLVFEELHSHLQET